MNALPTIGITIGDPAGIGAEIVLKALGNPRVQAICRPIVIGSTDVLRRAASVVGPELSIPSLQILDLGPVDLAQIPFGQVSAAGGKAGFEAIARAIELAMDGSIDAIVTCPINKEALRLAGYDYPGHTEIFTKLTGAKDSVMMLAHGEFRIAHVSAHLSLKQACDRVTRERVLRVIELTYQACVDLGIETPHIAVAGLNPHAGENGLFGDEEQNQIIPAIADAVEKEIRCTGPYPADTLFPRAASSKEYDACIAMYHDQGHVAVKMRGFDFDSTTGKWKSVSGINVTLGLPIVRVSVDHGTAFDISGKGIASEASLLDAMEYAAKMAARRKAQQP